MHRYTYTYTHICRDTSTHRHMHTDTHKCTCRHTHVTSYFITSNLLLSQNQQKSLLETGNPRKLLLQFHFKPKLAKIVTLSRKLKEIEPCQVNSATPTLISYDVHDDILQVPLVTAHFIFSCQLPNELRSPWTYFLLNCFTYSCSAPFFSS